MEGTSGEERCREALPVTIQCPRKNVMVPVNLELTVAEFRLARLRSGYLESCLACGGTHLWSKKIATLAPSVDGESREF